MLYTYVPDERLPIGEDFTELNDDNRKIVLEYIRHLSPKDEVNILKQMQDEDKDKFIEILNKLRGIPVIGSSLLNKALNFPSVEPFLAELFYTCGLQYFEIYDKQPLVYQDMVIILLDQYVRQIVNRREDFANIRKVNSLTMSIDMYAQMIKTMGSRIRSNQWTKIDNTTTIEQITEIHEIVLYFIRYANIRLTQIAIFLMSPYPYLNILKESTLDDKIKVLWQCYKVIRKSRHFYIC